MRRWRRLTCTEMRRTSQVRKPESQVTDFETQVDNSCSFTYCYSTGVFDFRYSAFREKTCRQSFRNDSLSCGGMHEEYLWMAGFRALTV